MRRLAILSRHSVTGSSVLASSARFVNVPRAHVSIHVSPYVTRSSTSSSILSSATATAATTRAIAHATTTAATTLQVPPNATLYWGDGSPPCMYPTYML
jgi:hypothetical protein